MDPTTQKENADPFEDVNETDDELTRPDVNQLADQIRETIDKFVRDQTNRGDMKMLATALKELRYAFKVFRGYQHERKVTVFGSARLPLDHPACKQAIDFGRRVVDAGFMVITGAANGIMEAGHIGAGREKSIGVNILLPFEQMANSIIVDDPKLMHFKYFFTRKLMFVKESDAVALFPGGFGTQDEGFEVLTLVQTGKSQMMPLVMIDEPGGDYWKHWLHYVENELVGRKLISPEDLALFKVTDSVEEAVEEVVGFYRVFHSMRFVRNDLVMRLQKRLSDKTVESLRENFQDILKSGTFRQLAALPEESEDEHLAHMPRLVFRFDRHSMGRLRMLINEINRAE